MMLCVTILMIFDVVFYTDQEIDKEDIISEYLQSFDEICDGI